MEELFDILEKNKVYHETLNTEVIPAFVVYEVIGQIVDKHIQDTYEILTKKLEDLSEDFESNIEEK